MLFFVLSGFVLTLSPLRAGLAGPATRPYTRLLGPVIRRYPRLAGPVVVTALLSIVLALTGGFPGVGWIAARARRDFPLDMFWGSQMHNDAAWPVLREAAFGTFVHGSADHNPVLWDDEMGVAGQCAGVRVGVHPAAPRAPRFPAGRRLPAIRHGRLAEHLDDRLPDRRRRRGVPPSPRTHAADAGLHGRRFVLRRRLPDVLGHRARRRRVALGKRHLADPPQLYLDRSGVRGRRLHAGHRAVLRARRANCCEPGSSARSGSYRFRCI